MAAKKKARKPAKKTAAKQKPAAKKKPAAKQKPAAKKKPAAKQKPAAKKKPAAKQKPAAKKKPAAKRKAAATTAPVAPAPAATAAVPAVGVPAPDFTVITDTGDPLTLSSLRGKRVVLYFYPKDDTPGCTVESCSFRDAFPRFSAEDAVILGVSPDSVKSHQAFKAKFSLPFTLLADESKAIAQAYGVWVEKSMYGRTYWGNARTTFVIGRDGRIARVFEKVSPDGHAAEVAAALADVA